MQYDCSFFSWANIDGHNPMSDESFGDWSFGSSNDGEPYVSSPGALVQSQAQMSLARDAARQVCGSPWCLPSREDFLELLAGTIFVDAAGNVLDPASNAIITVDGINIVILQSRTNGNRLIIPCCGLSTGSSWSARGTRISLWSSTFHNASNADNFYVSDTQADVLNTERFRGIPVRPVFKL